MKWWDVITHPLGLTGFALALVFGMFGAKLKERKRPWFLPVSIVLAALVIFGGLYLAYKQIKASSKNIHQMIIQNTEGVNSPAIHGNNNNVTIIHK